MKSFLAEKHVSPAAALKAPPPAPAVGIPAPLRCTPTVENPAANIETVKEGGKVVRIIVTCKCGERMEIDCIYPAGS